MIEKHVLGNFIPKGTKYLILGSFPAKGFGLTPGYDWYYGSKYNQFWKIIEKVYKIEFKDKQAKIELFTRLHIGIADIIDSCERRNGNSSDMNLFNITYNPSLIDILKENKVKTVYFTSVFVEKIFNKSFQSNTFFNNIKFITLPSPSPRYAKLTLEQKIETYQKLLPRKT